MKICCNYAMHSGYRVPMKDNRMTPKERMLAACRNQVPDRVPAAPDISNYIPCRFTGKPFWDIYINENPPLWKAYLEAVKELGIDGWFIYGEPDFRYESDFYWERNTSITKYGDTVNSCG